jgi:hypothetical protein
MQTNKIKPGDKVRFLNAVGGGKVTRIDAKQGLIYVEDEDGFEIPVLEKECVAVPEVNKTTNFPKRDFSTPQEDYAKSQKETTQKVKTEVVRAEEPVEIFETADGDDLRTCLTFIPTDIKNLSESKFDCLLINDSNYFLFYNFIIGDKAERRSIANGLIEPNMQEQLAQLSSNQLNDWENLQVQIVPFKKDKTYTPQSVIDISLQLPPLKFYKLHSFTENDYFDELALVLDLTQGDKSALFNISSEEIKKAMLQKEGAVKPKRSRPKVKLQSGIIEIDLHIHELTETTAGLSNADMLQLQLDKFHAVIDENKNNKGQKIVFIHGKGEGVLRNEILKLLKSRYKSYYFQDASFKEYGFGATMVVIK